MSRSHFSAPLSIVNRVTLTFTRERHDSGEGKRRGESRGGSRLTEAPSQSRSGALQQQISAWKLGHKINLSFFFLCHCDCQDQPNAANSTSF